LQACAVGLLWNSTVPDTDMKRDTALFTHCIFKNREMIDIYELAPHCATFDLSDEWTSIDICEKSDEGNQFYSQMAQKTAAVTDQLVSGLAVQINGVVDQNAVNNLVKAVCDAYQESGVRFKLEENVYYYLVIDFLPLKKNFKIFSKLSFNSEFIQYFSMKFGLIIK
jgi:hypothetical protein